MSKDKLPSTPAIRVLRDNGVAFSEHPYKYEDRGGTASLRPRASRGRAQCHKDTAHGRRGEAAGSRADARGRRGLDERELARLLGVKRVVTCSPETAQKNTGYMVGGISPFGTRKTMPVYMEETIAALPKIYINGGRRGLLVGLDPQELIRVLKPKLVKVGIPGGHK